MRKYLVVFNGGNGILGNSYVTMEGDIYTEECIRQLEKTLKVTNGFVGCTILNIIPLNDKVVSGLVS